MDQNIEHIGRDEILPLANLIDLAEQIANERDGCLTIVRHDAGWKAVLGDPDDLANASYEPTLESALLSLVLELFLDRWQYLNDMTALHKQDFDTLLVGFKNLADELAAALQQQATPETSL